MNTDDKFVEATNYFSSGGRMILRTALPRTHPESWESLWKKKYGTLDGFPYYGIFGCEPLFRMTIESLKEIIDFHDKNPDLSIEDLLEQFNIDGDFSEYGA